MVKYIYGRINVNMWMAAAEDPLPVHGVLLRQTRGQYVSQPSQLNPDLVAAVQKINVEVAFTMSTDTSDVIFGTLIDCQNELVLADGSQYQVVDSLADISKGGANKIKKFQYACLVKQEKVVLIWHDDIQKILTHAQEVEQKLLGLVSTLTTRREELY
jgi:predicted neutral ceramidase superfamily lipid hydrolase